MSGEDDAERIEVDGRVVELSRARKPLYPDGGPTKHDLAYYWRRVAPVALAHLRGRALTLRRFPDGIGAEGFFQKQASDWFPDWVPCVAVATAHGDIGQVTADSAAVLVYLAGQAAIELHVALARADRPRQPDRLVFDLDPSDDDFGKVRAAAHALLALLDDLALPAFLQTTGSRGLHVVVPLRRGPDFDEVREFSRAVATHLVERAPARLTLEQRLRERRDRVYLDCQRNAHGQTAVAPYSPRALPGAPLATPIDRDDLDDDALGPRRYRVDNIFRRLARKGCPWRDMDAHAAALGDARERLRRLRG